MVGILWEDQDLNSLDSFSARIPVILLTSFRLYSHTDYLLGGGWRPGGWGA
jgi:hypothetical protein